MDTFHNGKKVACPASADFLDPLAASYKLHFASKAELEKHGGVCKQCAEKFKKRGAAILVGKIETPGAMVPPPPQMPDDHAAWQNVSGENYAELIQTSEFNFDEIDRALGLVESAPEDARQLAGELVRQLMVYCFKSRGNLKTAAAKFAMIGAGLRPDALNDASQTELAAQLNLTKAALSKSSVNFQKAFGIKFARSRSATGRAKMRAARLSQGGINHRHKKKSDTGTSNQTVTYKPAEGAA